MKLPAQYVVAARMTELAHEAASERLARQAREAASQKRTWSLARWLNRSGRRPVIAGA
jgi:hypothetical protein